MEILILIFVGIVGTLGIFMCMPTIDNGAKERNANRKARLQKVFSEQVMGTPFSEVANRFGDCEAISSPNLVSEIILENGVNRKVYIWNLDWEYVVSKSSGVGVMPIHTTTFNTGGNGMSFSNGTATSFSSGQTTRKAFIQMVFEDNKLVAKEQQGLYE